MKLNQRDKILLIVVLVVLVWVAGIMLFIKPAIQDVSSASKTLDEKEMELDKLNAQIKADENLPQETQTAYDKAKETADVFYDKMAQYDAMHIVEGLLEDEADDGKNPIDNLNLYITEMTTATLERYVYEPNASSTLIDNIIDGSYNSEDVAQQAQTVGVSITDIDVNMYAMTFDFECTKASLIKFINVLQTRAQKSLVISELEIKDMGANEDDTELNGTMTLSFMMIQDIMSPEEAQAQAADDEAVQEVNAEAE